MYGFFVVIGILATLASFYSLLMGWQFERKAARTIHRPKLGFRPRVCLIIPCKGEEPNLARNIEAALTQLYDNYKTVVVTDTIEDPAYKIAKSIIERHPSAKATLFISEPSPECSGKVAAVLTAIKHTRGQVDAYAFLDSDALVPAHWLGDLIDPLADPTIGSTTGFRWYFPSRGGLWSYVQSAWNALGTNIFFDDRYNFPWGGAMAVQTITMNRVSIEKAWSAAISDDMALNLALRRHGYRIQFLPQCTVATFNQTSLADFLEWATRQTVLTRIYNRGLWNYAVGAYSFLNFAFVLGLLAAVLGILLEPTWFIPSALLLSPSVLGIARSYQRTLTFAGAMPEFKREFELTRFPLAMASLIVPWVMAYCLLKSARTRAILWRGRRYDLTPDGRG